MRGLSSWYWEDSGITLPSNNRQDVSRYTADDLERHGRSTYEALFRLVCGEDPKWVPRDPEGVAISYCLRVFDDAYVGGVPEPEPGLEVLVRPGMLLSEQGVNDSQSYRLAIFSEVGATREEAVARCGARARSLAFQLLPVRAAAAFDR